MKIQCDHCAIWVNVTISPNDVEGYFITEQALEELIDSHTSLSFREIAEKSHPAMICPKCNNISGERNGGWNAYLSR